MKGYHQNIGYGKLFFVCDLLNFRLHLSFGLYFSFYNLSTNKNCKRLSIKFGIYYQQKKKKKKGERRTLSVVVSKRFSQQQSVSYCSHFAPT